MVRLSAPLFDRKHLNSSLKAQSREIRLSQSAHRPPTSGRRWKYCGLAKGRRSTRARPHAVLKIPVFSLTGTFLWYNSFQRPLSRQSSKLNRTHTNNMVRSIVWFFASQNKSKSNMKCSKITQIKKRPERGRRCLRCSVSSCANQH